MDRATASSLNSTQTEDFLSLSSDGPDLKRPTVSLKLATEEDWFEVLRISRSFHEFYPYRSIPFQEDKVRILFDRYLSNPLEMIVIVAKTDEKTIGVLVGHLSELYFSNTKVAGELIWWVDEEYRRTKAGIQLFHAFEFWARKVSASFISGVNTSETTDVSKVYIRNGYHLAETTYVKEIN